MFEVHDGSEVLATGFDTYDEAFRFADNMERNTGLNYLIAPEGSLEKELNRGKIEIYAGELPRLVASIYQDEVKPIEFACSRDQRWDRDVDPFTSSRPDQKAEMHTDTDEMRIDYLFAPLERAIQVAWPDAFLDAMIMQSREEKAQAQLLALQELETQTHITCGSKSRGGKDNE
jgi:hypothetical protein